MGDHLLCSMSCLVVVLLFAFLLDFASKSLEQVLRLEEEKRVVFGNSSGDTVIKTDDVSLPEFSTVILVYFISKHHLMSFSVSYKFHFKNRSGYIIHFYHISDDTRKRIDSALKYKSQVLY